MPKKRRLKVIGSVSSKNPIERVRPDLRVERLTTSEMKSRFARNLDRLLGIVGLSRKEAADETGIDYRVIRRLVSDGISRIDERGEPDLQRLIKFFHLKNETDLWAFDLLPKLLTTEYGTTFVQRFRSRLEGTLSQRLVEASNPEYDEVAMLRIALGHSRPTKNGNMEAENRKIAVILSSDKAEHFRNLIDDYFDFVTGTKELRHDRKVV